MRGGFVRAVDSVLNATAYCTQACNADETLYAAMLLHPHAYRVWIAAGGCNGLQLLSQEQRRARSLYGDACVVRLGPTDTGSGGGDAAGEPDVRQSRAKLEPGETVTTAEGSGRAPGWKGVRREISCDSVPGLTATAARQFQQKPTHVSVACCYLLLQLWQRPYTATLPLHRPLPHTQHCSLGSVLVWCFPFLLPAYQSMTNVSHACVCAM